MKNNKLIYILALLLLSSCNNEAWVKPDSITLGCSDYLSILSSEGTLYNNVWNKKAANDYEWSQCIEKKMANKSEIYGWSWNWPLNKWPISNNNIYAYPQIKRGVSPWDPKPTVNKQFPLKISELKSLTISHDVYVNTNGQHNLATSMWLVNSPNISEESSKSLIMAELMIWTYSTQEHFNPAGKKYGTFTSTESSWEVWVDKNWGDLSGENINKWTYVTFRAMNSQLKRKFNALDLIQYAIEKNILKNEWYISDIELGTEIRSGSGIAWINSFNVNIN